MIERNGSRRIGRRGGGWLLLLCVGLLVGCEAGGGPEPIPADLAIEGVAVVDVVTGTVEEDRTVLVRGDRIVAVGPASELRAGPDARIVDGRGRFLIPGLWDMHVHLTHDTGTLPLHLAHGVTGVRDMGGPPDSVLRVRDRIRSGALEGPWVVAAGPVLDGPKPGVPWRLTVETAAEGATAVDSVVAMGADLVKVHNGLSPPAFRGIAERAARVGAPLAGHAPPSVGLGEAVAAGMGSVEHTTAILEAALPRESFASFDALRVEADSFLERAGRGVFAEMAERRIRATPTVVAGFAAARRLDPAREPAPEEGWVTEGVRDFWTLMGSSEEVPPEVIEARMMVAELGLELVGAMHTAGVPLMAGTDVGLPTVVPGHSLHEELELLVEAGLTPAGALRAATVEPARHLGGADTLGTVEVGKRADLVLLAGNPVEEIGNVRRIDAVVVRGRLLDRDALDRMLPPLTGGTAAAPDGSSGGGGERSGEAGR